LTQKRNGEAQTFVQLSYLEAELEKKKKSSFLFPLLPFAFWMAFLRGTKNSETRETK